MDIIKEREALEARLTELKVYESLREKFIQTMNWDCMVYRPADEEHTDSWYEAPSEDDTYLYPIYQAYQRILEKLDKAMSK